MMLFPDWIYLSMEFNVSYGIWEVHFCLIFLTILFFNKITLYYSWERLPYFQGLVAVLYFAWSSLMLGCLGIGNFYHNVFWYFFAILVKVGYLIVAMMIYMMFDYIYEYKTFGTKFMQVDETSHDSQKDFSNHILRCELFNF